MTEIGSNMGHLQIYWSDRLENLANAMFSNTQDGQDPFATECTVVGSTVMAGWLKQYFLGDYPKTNKKQHVLACWNFEMLHPFVNDWLAKAVSDTVIGKRAPAEHPYSPDVLQWRIWNLLCDDMQMSKFASLHDYIGNDTQIRDRKRWALSQRLAKLFDDYQNYRPDLLVQWSNGENTGLDEHLFWQADLWRQLLQDNNQTYLDQFLKMDGKLQDCGITDAYRRITVFHTSAMPAAYMQFFALLGSFMPVEMYIFNPSQEFWFDDPTVKQDLRGLIKNVDEHTDEIAWMDPPHPLLSGFARATQAFLGTLLEAEGDQKTEIGAEMWGEDCEASLLHKVQQDIRRKNLEEDHAALFEDTQADQSLQFHICHSPMREVEVVKDLILKWFDENKDLDPPPQPRDVQVLVPDMEAYAPFIESIFRVTDVNPPLPCSITNRPAISAGALGAAFVKLMQCNDSRMSAPEVIGILELYPVRQRYGLTPDDVSEIRVLVNVANIRWGRDGNHLNAMMNPIFNDEQTKNQKPKTKNLPDTVTWRRGLDRLIAGFTIGRCMEHDEMMDAGELGSLRIVDAVEGGSAVLIGKLSQFYEDLCQTADETAKGSQPASLWATHFYNMLERFFRGTENSFREIAEIRRGITAVEKAARTAGNPTVSSAIMATAIEAQLGGMAPAGKTDTNAVLFSPMRTMQVTPRKLIIMLGVNEGVFPRPDQRPAFDLLAKKPRYGDRSLRYEDRLAFLEAIMSARKRLIITYTGRNISNNKEIPPSPAITEFLQFLQTCAPDKEKPLIMPVDHRLHTFNPAYYQHDSKLFSYSQSNHAAARILAGPPLPAQDHNPAIDATDTQVPPGDREESIAITLEYLQNFFTNPAKDYYVNMLGIRFLDPGREELSDCEIFDADSLDTYKLNQAIIDTILAQPVNAQTTDFVPDGDCFQWLQESALSPLGTFGRGEIRYKIHQIKNFLNRAESPDNSITIYQLLRMNQAARKKPTPISLYSGHYQISAGLPILDYPGGGNAPRSLFCFRYASINAKDYLKAWLAHVIGHAQGETFETVIAGKNKIEGNESDARKVLKTMPQEAAIRTLQKLITLYDRGRREAIPFAPKTSCEFAREMADAPNEDVGLGKAEAAWSGHFFPEYDDPYLYAAWRDEGPMVAPTFKDDALAFWQDFFTNSEPHKDGTDMNTAPTEDADA